MKRFPSNSSNINPIEMIKYHQMINPMETTPHHGQLLRQFLDEHHIDIPTFADLLKEEVSSLSTVYKILESETISKARLCFICTIFNLSPTYFGKPEDYFEPILNLPNIEQDKRLVIYNYIKESKGNYNTFVNEYFETFRKCVFKTKKSIYVMDYLASKSGLKLKDSIAFFHEENKKYFEAVQQHIENQVAEDNKIGFDYRRICQLPLHAFLEEEEVSFERKVEFVVESLFEETFEHFCWCYKVLGEEQFKLYVAQHPIRLYSYYIFDRNTIVSEYLRFDIYGSSIPDILFVNKLSNPMRDETTPRLMDNYVEEFEKMQQETVLSKQKIIPKTTFFYSPTRSLARIQEKIKEKNQELREKEDEYNFLIDRFIQNSEIIPSLDDKETEKSLQAEKHKLNKEITELQLIEENLQTKRSIVQKYTEG